MRVERASIHPLRRRVADAARWGFVTTMGRPTAMDRAWPGVVVIGAQRAGTTSLWRWLTAHPGFRSPILGMKGVHWLDLAADRSEAWYRGHFPRRASLDRSGAITGEASPYYLYHPRVPHEAATRLPSSTRFVALLREPADRAVSHYHHMRDEGTEPLPTLESALDAEAARLAGSEARLLRDPGAVDHHHLHHSYVSRGEYATQLERWFDAVGRERVMVVDSGRLRREPDAVLAAVCDHVGLDPAAAPAPSRAVNAGRYDPPAPATIARLRAHFAPHDARLWDLLGERWW